MAYDGKEFRGPNGVNVAEILRVADLVEKSPSFDMRLEFHPCGTPACIFGHVISSREEWFAQMRPGDGCYQPAARLLGLSYEQTIDLCQPERTRADYTVGSGERGFITNAHAAACLRNLAATGEVDWIGTKPAASQPMKGEGK